MKGVRGGGREERGQGRGGDKEVKGIPGGDWKGRGQGRKGKGKGKRKVR